MTSLMKPRSGYSGFNRDQLAKHSRPQQGERGTFVPITGKFDNWYPEEHPTWVSICPNQQWTYEFYNKSEREVVTLTTEYLQVKEHYVGFNKRRFNCSAGAHKDKECYGCSERKAFYNRRDEMQNSGIPIDDSEMPPISEYSKYALSITLLEMVGEYTKLDAATGQPKKSGKGKTYTHFMAARVGTRLKLKPKATFFGKRFHWSFSHEQLTALAAINDQLSTHCANCAEGLTAVLACCSQCAEPLEEWMYANVPKNELGQNLTDENGNDQDPFVAHEHLLEDKAVAYTCGACGFKGIDDEDKVVPPLYTYICPCSDPVEGNLLSFELHLGSVKLSGNKNVPTLAGFRVRQARPQLEGAEELIFVPLDLAAIYAPDKLSEQLKLINPNRRTLATPNAHLEEHEQQESHGEGSKKGINF